MVGHYLAEIGNAFPERIAFYLACAVGNDNDNDLQILCSFVLSVEPLQIVTSDRLSLLDAHFILNPKMLLNCGESTFNMLSFAILN